MLTVVAALLAVGVPDTALVREFSTLLETAPIERLEGFSGSTRVTDVLLSDLDGDGVAEAVVSLRPALRQTPTLLIFRRSASGGWERILEGLAPGRLMPVSGAFGDSHVHRVGADLTAGDGSPESVQRVLTAGSASKMSLVAYRGWFHGDVRVGATYVMDLSSWSLPHGTENTCEQFEFSLPLAVVAGTLSGAGAQRYLVALTAHDVTIYRIEAITANGRLVQQSWLLPRPSDVTALSLAADGSVHIVSAAGASPIRVP